MKITLTRYLVAFVSGDKIVEHEIEVRGADELRAELEARRAGIRGPQADSNGGTTTVNDLGDIRNREALDVWAALVRLGLYSGKSQEFRLKDFVGAEKIGDPQPVDPTSPETSDAPA